MIPTGFGPYLPAVASDAALAASDHLTRERAVIFLDVAGFTGLSERLARHGTAGTEQLGVIVRRVIGGSCDIVSRHGGDALAFGGDAITVAFADSTAARRAADEAVELVHSVSGTETLAGPVALSMHVGVAAGEVTTVVCAGRTRHVVAHLGNGLDRAVAAADGHDVPGTGAFEPDRPGPLPGWASRVLHPVTASRVAAGSRPPNEHRRITTAFLSLPPVDPDELATFVAAAADVVTETSGDVLQCTGGDKGIVLIAVFGVPVANPDDAVRTVHAIARLRTRTDVPFAAGVSTGLAFTGAFGGETRRFASVLGDSTNLAARLMAAAEPGTTLVDDATAAASGAHLGTPRSIVVKNRDEPAQVAEVLGLPAAGEFAADGDTPLVGRAEELAAAERLLDAGAGALHLVGDAGSGKSRLAAEIARHAGVRGLDARVLRFEPFGGGQPLGPFLDAVGPVAPATARLSPQERAELTRQLVANALTDAGGVLIVEDVHWADDESRALLAGLDPARVCLVTTGRDDPGLAGETIVLADLPASDLRTIALDTWGRLGGADLPAAYLDEIAERAAGSPLFAQTVTELARRDYRPGTPLPEVPLPDRLLPFLTARLDALGDSAQATALRMAVLARPVRPAGMAEVFGVDADRDVELLIDSGIARSMGGYVMLRHASVGQALLGRASHADRAPLHTIVCRYLLAVGAPARDVASHLEHCEIPELAQDTYRRARDEAATLWALREAHHWAELAIAGGDAKDLVALAALEQQLGRHAEAEERLRGLDGPDAARLLGRIAFETGRPAEAVEHLEEAERLGAAGAGIEWPLTMALCDLGRFADARARAEAQLVTDDPELRLDALANLGAVEALDGNVDRAAAVLQEGRVLAAELGDELRRAHVTSDLAGVTYLAGRPVEAAQLLDEAAALADRLGARRLVAMALGNLALLRLAGGDLDGAAREGVAATDAAISYGDAGIALNVIEAAIDAAELSGDLELAARWWRRHAELGSRLGRPEHSAVSWFRHAALTGSNEALAAGDAAAAGLDTEDLALHRARATAAIGGRYEPPPVAATTAFELPSLDANLPPVTPQIVDALFGRIAVRLDELAPVHF
jgi:class 3 adenylate cyclase/tetratricopeptide (TPR) repeat protein